MQTDQDQLQAVHGVQSTLNMGFGVRMKLNDGTIKERQTSDRVLRSHSTFKQTQLISATQYSDILQAASELPEPPKPKKR